MTRNNYTLFYVSADGPGEGATWSVYREEYHNPYDDEPIDGSAVQVATVQNETVAHDIANYLQLVAGDSR